MGIHFVPYTPDREEAVRAFNRRLERGGCAFQFFESSAAAWLPRGDDPAETLYEEYFVAAEDAMIRGGYALKHQEFLLQGRIQSVGCIYLPLSEGAVDNRYGKVGVQLLAHALKRQPLIYCLGMGNLDNPYPRLLRAAGWSLRSLPFFFRVLRPEPFLRNLAYVRRSTAGRMILDTLAASGLGALGVAAGKRLLALVDHEQEGAEVQCVDAFGGWADTLWEETRGRLTLGAVRDQRALNRLYPARKARFLKLLVSRGPSPVGWAVVLDTQMSGHKQFGAMRVGSLVDGLARPGSERAVLQAVVTFLEARSVDLIVTNQSHEDWVAACPRVGFLWGPSNFIFAASPTLARQLSPFEMKSKGIHVLRGDGEGPSHL